MISFASLSLVLSAAAAVVELPAASLPHESALASLQAAAPAAPKWTGSISGGGVVTTGNSDTRNGNASASAEYKREKDRITLGFLWTYAEEQNTTQQWNLSDRKTVATAKYDYFLDAKTYLLGQVSAESDLAADLDLRTTIGAGVGRQFREDAVWKLSAEAGLTWVNEEFDSSLPASADDDYFAARAAGKAEYVHSKVWSFAEDVLYLQSVEDLDDSNFRFDTRAKATFTESFFAQLQWIVDFDNTPQASTGTDHRWLLGVGWKF